MPKKLTNRLVLIFIIPLIVLVLVQMVSLSSLWQQQQAEREANYRSVTASVSNNVNLILNGVFKSVTTFSYSQVVQQLLSPDVSAKEQFQLRAYLKELATFSRKYNPELVEVMISGNDSIESLYGFYTQEILNYVTERTLGTDKPASTDRSFHFIDVSSQGSATTYVLLTMPVFDARIRGIDKSVGFVTVVCSVSNLKKAMNVGEGVVVNLMESNGNVVVSSSDVIVGNTAYSVTLEPSSLTLRFAFAGAEQPGFHWGSSTLIMWFVLVVLFLAFTVAATNLLIVRPVKRLNDDISEVLEDYPNQRLPAASPVEIDSITEHINQMLESIFRLNEDVINAQKNLFQTEIEKNKSQIYAFQSQVNPHFLFNTLQCIRSKALLHNEAQIAQMCTKVSLILRYSLSANDQVPLKEELSVVEKYLDIICIRYENKITYAIEVADEALLSTPIPKMVVQPLVENAVFHGLEPLAGSGHIRVIVEADDAFVIKVIDNGIGFEPERLAALNAQLAGASEGYHFTDTLDEHIGILNVHNRIRLRYGDGYGLQAEATDDETCVQITMPCPSTEKSSRRAVSMAGCPGQGE